MVAGSSIQAAPHDTEYVQLETLMMKELDRLPPMSPSRCIFRVPDRLRCVREKAYTPQVISIGPLHHGKEALKAMEEHKKRYWYPRLSDENDCIFGKPRLVNDVWLDLYMLENQLPFFILEDLFDPHIFPVPSDEYSDRLNGVGKLSILFLSRYFLNDGLTFGGMLNNLETIYYSEAEVQHLVDLLIKLCVGPILKEQYAGKSKHTTPPSITELHLAGVKFKVGSSKNLFDIRFKDGILEIPKLKTTYSTELILRNLVAFDQCTLKQNCTSDYVNIMDVFLATPKDVELLVKYRIIEKYLGGGDNGLSTMISNLSTGVVYDCTNFYYGTLCEDLNKFCSSKWHKSMANLKDNYFNSPWTTISFVAAVVLLILTVIQTICSIISLPSRER